MIRIYPLTRTEKKAGTATSGPITAEEVNVTSYGEYTWRFYTETVFNNGFQPDREKKY